MLTDWSIRVGEGRPRPVAAVVPVEEGQRLCVSGLSPSEAVTVGGVGMSATAAGELQLELGSHDEFRCHVGLLEVAAADGRSFEFDIRPGKMSAERFQQLRQDLQEMWAGVVIDPTSSTSTAALANPADRLWDDRTRAALDSLLTVPPSQLRPLPTFVPIDRARQLTTVTASFVDAMHSGRNVQALAPTPVICSRELGLVRDSLERLRALSRRQRALTPTGTAQAERLDQTARSISRYLEHPLLREHRYEGPPTHLMRADRRLRRLLELRSAISNSNAPVVEGPGELRLGLRGLDRLYEMWVFLAVLKAAAARYGAPLTGIETLARRLPGHRLRLHLADGTEVVFPGGVRVVFNPAVRSDPRMSWKGLELAAHPMDPSPANLATPDVMVLGPGRDAVVIDAKYRARHLVDRAAAEIHHKYSRIRRHGDGVVQHVAAFHPHDTYAFRYSGYSMLPCAPGIPFPDIPWPEVETRLHPVVQPSVGATGAADESEPTGVPDPAEPLEGGAVALPAAARRPRGTRLSGDPDLVLVDQTWTRHELGSRRLDLRVLAEFTGVGPRSPGYFVGYSGSGMETFIRAVRLSGWRVADAVDLAAVMAAFERLVIDHGAKDVVAVTGNDRLIDLLESLCDAVEVVDDLDMVIRR
jgi:hypothetical protein